MDFLSFYERHQNTADAILDLIGNIGGPVGFGIATIKVGLSHGIDKRKSKSQLSAQEVENLHTLQDTLQPHLEKLIENLEENQEFKNATTEEERVSIVKNNNALSSAVEEMQEIVHKTMTMHAKDLVLFGDDFQIVSQLGRGGEGEVVCAYHCTSGKTVALKIFPSGLSQSAVESLKRRYNLVSRLRHSNIVPYLNLLYEANKDQYYFVMDYIAGRTLESKIKEEKIFSIYDTIRLLLPIAQALDFTHGKNIIHRDLKPANILLQEPDGIFLADFGLATEVKASLAELTGNTLLKVGTMAYMAPEQYYQDPINHPLSFYTDNWAFGVIVYEMLEGKLPFNGGMDWRCFKSLVCEEEVPTPNNLSAECWSALKPCFERDPKKRPENLVSVLFNLFQASDCEHKDEISKLFGSYESYTLKEQVQNLTERIKALELENANLTESIDKIKEILNTCEQKNNKIKRMNGNSELETLPIEKLELGIRASACLKSLGVHTVGDLLQYSESDLLKLRNMGYTSLYEIKQQLEEYGLHLRNDSFQESQKKLENSGLDLLKIQEMNDNGKLDTLPIEKLELSIRARKCLEHLGVHTVGDLLKRSSSDLLGCSNYGNTSLQEIKQKLEEYCIKLKNDSLQENKQELENSNLHSDSLKIQNDNGKLDTLPIDKLGLDIEAELCVSMLGVDTVGDLLQHSELDLLKIGTIGEKSLQKIKQKLKKYGLYLRGDSLQESKQKLESSNLYSDSLKIQNDNGELDTTLPVEKLELGKLARRCFEELNIHTIGDLLQHSEIDLLKTKYAGHFFIQRIKNKLKEYNIALKEYSLNELNILPIDKLELQSAGSVLKRGNIHTIGDLLQYSEEELLATEKISTQSQLKEIRNRLKEYGLSLTVY